MKTYERECHEYNALMRRLKSKTKTYDEYVAYRKGQLGKPRGSVKTGLTVSNTYRRESPKIPSGDTYESFKAPKTEKKYTGDKLLGIAVMHKSNLVPVFHQEDAEDIARMRR